MPKKNKKFDAVIKTSGRRKKRRRFLFTRKFIFSKYSVGIFIFLLIGGTLVYYAFFSGEFLIKSVDIQGVEPQLAADIQRYYQEEADEERFIFLKQDNVFLFPTGEFERNILQDMPNLKFAEVNISIPSSVEIKTEERKQEGIWCNYHEDIIITECYFYDADGV
ncbi:MAG: hypothetical protein R3251_03725, partial [Candidatus Spechtbacterales bacterium]|nr:hypothetical protein [Candidatus Spechtbacterales bacterium]